jgi:hypothetical protein
MNEKLKEIIKKYLRKVVLPYHGFDYDEVIITMQPLNFETIPQKYRLFFDFKFNPYKVLLNGYNDYRSRSQFEIKIDNDLRTLGTAFNVQCGWDFENDVEMTDKFAKEYIPIFRNKIKKNGLEKDLDIAFGWNDEASGFEFFINDYDLSIEDKEIILETYGEMFGNIGFRIDFGDY